MKSTRLFVLVLLLLLTGLGMNRAGWSARAVSPSALQVAALIVTNANDSGDGSLRKAIQDANANPNATTTITFATPFFSTPRTITLTSGELAINSNLTITGSGANLVTISGNNASRILSISSGFNVFISGLSLTSGNGVGAALSGTGGAILNNGGTLNLSSSVVSGSVTSDEGGAIRNASLGTMTITNSTISGNTAGGFGGGIRVSNGTVNVIGSTISGNTGNGGVDGGGIDCGNGTLNVTNSTISGNSTPNGTVSGGGIYARFGTVTIINSTITNNSAAGASGVYVFSGTVTVRNSIIAGNVNNATVPDVVVNSDARMTSNGFNLIGNRGTVTFGGSGDQSGTGAAPLNPLLGPLQNNGGPTPTHALLGGSPALNAGNASGATTDQRGVPRVSGVSADIGAVEMQALIVTNTTDSLGAGTLRQAITDANANGPGLDDIIFGIPPFNTTQTINLLTALPNITSNLTINGPGANLLTVRRAFDATSDFRIFTIAQGAPQVAISGLTITGGRASNGGGILSNSKLMLTNVHVTGNQASSGGGGVDLESADGVFTGCTFSANLAGDGGGILYQDDEDHTLRLLNTTVSGNQITSGGGGGIRHYCDSGESRLEIVSSTIVSNAGGSGSGGIYARVDEGTATLAFRNTIIANNTPSNLATRSLFGAPTLTSLGFNLSDNFNSQMTPLGNDITTATPRLGPLSLNGGTTPTHALLGGSPALNAGNASGSTTDQRGVPRVSGISADVGAVEMQALLVSNTNDAGDGSLRAAITAANANGAGLDDILFNNTVFNTSRTINLLTALPNITSNMTVNGPGANLLTVRRADNAATEFRIFTVSGGTSNVALSGLTSSNGRSFTGGAIESQSHLTLTNVHITGNQAVNGGGGISLLLADGTFTGCTFSGNTAGNQGGGIVYQGNGGHTLRLVNSTVSGNAANNGGLGGGIIHFSSSGSSKLEVVNSTIANNTSATTKGGGIYTTTFNGSGETATTTLRNSIVANNTPNSLVTALNGATITSLGFNLTSDNILQTLEFLNQPTDFVNTDPLLGPLQDNGGPTPTHALRFGSRALDAGHSSGAMTDQRGLPRRVDLSTINNERDSDGADIGAYEAQSAPVQPPPPTVAINDVSKNEGNSGQTAFDFTVTLSTASAQTVTVDYISGGGTATSGSDYTAVEGRLTFAPGQTSKTITVQVNGDTAVEPNETFLVELRSPSNATLADAQGLGTILNDDAAPSLLVENVNDSGTSSLRQVIADAPAGSVVTFAPATFSVARTITLATEIQINKSLTINGPGANLLTIAVNNTTRVLRVLGSGVNVTINDVTIRNGNANGSIGGGILSNGELTMNRCHLMENRATTSGGGIYLDGANGTFNACTFSGNQAANGGGIYFNGTRSGQTLMLTNCTFSNNTGTTTGGALAHAGMGGSTVTQINSCTIANNDSADGGGIYIGATGANISAAATTRNSIYANNSNTNLRFVPANGGAATITSQGFNLTTGSGSGVLSSGGDQLNTDPLLGPLQNNGGPTPTRALLAGSPAQDKGQSAGLTNDQRGNARPFDDPALNNASAGDGADIGAFEQGQQIFPVSAASYTTPLAQESIVATFGVNLSNGVGIAGTIPLPTTLNEASFTVRDSLGVERAAPLFFAAPGQVNFQVPPGTAVGTATIIARRNGTPTAGALMMINAAEPGLFTANSSGTGLPAGNIFRLKANGEQFFEPIAAYNAATQRFDPVPINLAPAGDRVFLILYGTGIRFHGGLGNVKVNVAGLTLDALFAADPGGFIGLDQVNSAELPRTLAGRGQVNVTLLVGAKSSNTVTLNFK